MYYPINCYYIYVLTTLRDIVLLLLLLHRIGISITILFEAYELSFLTELNAAKGGHGFVVSKKKREKNKKEMC